MAFIPPGGADAATIVSSLGGAPTRDMLQSCVGRPSLSAIPADLDPSVDIAEELFDDLSLIHI
eukprot:6819509-Prymnesium_polylepis.1